MFSLHIDTARTWRGGQNQVLLTVMGMRSAGHRAELVAHPDGELRRRAKEGLDLVPLAPRTEMDFSAGWRLGRVLRRQRPDVLHAHDPHAVAMAALAVSMDPRGPRPLIVASRRVDFHLKMNAFSRWKYRQVDVFICASEAIRKMLAGDGIDPARMVTVHEGIDVGRVDAIPAADVHAEFWLPHDAPVVGNIAALVPHKGQHDLVEAAAIVVREVPDARFLVFGEGELRASLEQQIRHHHLQKHVLLAGFRPDVLAMLKAFDLLVMSSRSEGLGTTLLDGMAAGKAIVATRVGGIPEAIEDGETGLLVPPADPRALARAIVTMLGDATLRARFGARGRARAVKHFSVDRMVGETVKVYEAWAGRPRAGGTAYPAGGD